MNPRNRKEYLTTARTLTELREQEPQLRAAGFRKRRHGGGQSPNTGEFYQWWDRKDAAQNRSHVEWVKRQRDLGRCIICGSKAAVSARGGPSQYCDTHRKANREYMRRYMRVRNNSQREYRVKSRAAEVEIDN